MLKEFVIVIKVHHTVLLSIKAPQPSKRHDLCLCGNQIVSQRAPVEFNLFTNFSLIRVSYSYSILSRTRIGIKKGRIFDIYSTLFWYVNYAVGTFESLIVCWRALKSSKVKFLQICLIVPGRIPSRPAALPFLILDWDIAEVTKTFYYSFY